MSPKKKKDINQSEKYYVKCYQCEKILQVKGLTYVVRCGHCNKYNKVNMKIHLKCGSCKEIQETTMDVDVISCYKCSAYNLNPYRIKFKNMDKKKMKKLKIDIDKVTDFHHQYISLNDDDDNASEYPDPFTSLDGASKGTSVKGANEMMKLEDEDEDIMGIDKMDVRNQNGMYPQGEYQSKKEKDDFKTANTGPEVEGLVLHMDDDDDYDMLKSMLYD